MTTQIQNLTFDSPTFSPKHKENTETRLTRIWAKMKVFFEKVVTDPLYLVARSIEIAATKIYDIVRSIIDFSGYWQQVNSSSTSSALLDLFSSLFGQIASLFSRFSLITEWIQKAKVGAVGLMAVYTFQMGLEIRTAIQAKMEQQLGKLFDHAMKALDKAGNTASSIATFIKGLNYFIEVNAHALASIPYFFSVSSILQLGKAAFEARKCDQVLRFKRQLKNESPRKALNSLGQVETEALKKRLNLADVKAWKEQFNALETSSTSNQKRALKALHHRLNVVAAGSILKAMAKIVHAIAMGILLFGPLEPILLPASWILVAGGALLSLTALVIDRASIHIFKNKLENISTFS